jgi:hypothetical protein
VQDADYAHHIPFSHVVNADILEFLDRPGAQAGERFARKMPRSARARRESVY